MVSILTADIIQSRQIQDPAVWLTPLKKLLNTKGGSPEIWEIYRGDSFQVEVPPADVLKTAFQIKATIKQVRNLDVRIAVGIGEKGYDSSHITESSGDAFVRSGELLERLKQEKVHLAIKSPDDDFDRELNMMLRLALVILNSWSVNSAEIAALLLAAPDLSQKEAGERLGIVQSSVSERINRGSIHEILNLETYYRERVQRLAGAANG